MTKDHMYFGGVGCGLFIGGAAGFGLDPHGLASGLIAVIGLGLVAVVVIDEHMRKPK